MQEQNQLPTETMTFAGQKFVFNGSGLDTDLHEGLTEGSALYGAMHAIESMTLAMRQAGYDLEDPAFAEVMETVLPTCFNDLEGDEDD